MKTLADLKRDAMSGNMSMEMLEWYGKTGEDIKPILRGIRKVEGANSVAISLLNNDGNISELRFSSAKLIEYDGETLTFYAAAHRELTEEEQAILAEWKKIEDEYEKQNPFGNCYWKKKDFFRKCSCPWLDGNETVRGKRMEWVNGRNMIRDNSIKGEVTLKYKVYFTNGGVCSA